MYLILKYQFENGRGEGSAKFKLPDPSLPKEEYTERLEETLFFVFDFVESVEKDEGQIIYRGVI